MNAEGEPGVVALGTYAPTNAGASAKGAGFAGILTSDKFLFYNGNI
jgi:hypothetical protein